MNRSLRLVHILFVFLMVLAPLKSVFSAEEVSHPIQYLTFDEFDRLAVDVAQKVNLFRDLWGVNESVQIFGGVTRDYLFWLKLQFDGVASRDQALTVANRLRDRQTVDVREFLAKGSDVDVMNGEKLGVDPKTYGLEKLEAVDSGRLNLSTEKGRAEFDQGFLPAEKMRLGKTGFIQTQDFGNGEREIYKGNLTIHFADPAVFAKTHYAQMHLNHPLLLVLRYFRLLAADGRIDRLYADSPTVERIRSTVADAKSGGEFARCLQKEQFRKWLNATVQRTFRNRRGPEIPRQLYEFFEIDKVAQKYAGAFEPYSHFLNSKPYDEKIVAETLRLFGTTADKLYLPTAHAIKDLRLYHGTKSEENFKSILLEGVRFSTKGWVGEGLYAVGVGDIESAADHGGSLDRVVEFEVAPDARVIDLTRGEGKRVFESYSKKHGKNFDAFAKEFGADILVYKWTGGMRAYSVKNGLVLLRSKGVARDLIPYNELLGRAEKATSLEEIANVLYNLSITRVTIEDVKEILETKPFEKLDIERSWMGLSLGDGPAETLALIAASLSLLTHIENLPSTNTGTQLIARKALSISLRTLFGWKVAVTIDPNDSRFNFVEPPYVKQRTLLIPLLVNSLKQIEAKKRLPFIEMIANDFYTSNKVTGGGILKQMINFGRNLQWVGTKEIGAMFSVVSGIGHLSAAFLLSNGHAFGEVSSMLMIPVLMNMAQLKWAIVNTRNRNIVEKYLAQFRKEEGKLAFAEVKKVISTLPPACAAELKSL